MPTPREPVGISFTITTRTKEAPVEIEAALNRALNRIAIKWHAAARQATPVDTGRLRSSVTFATPTVQQPARIPADDGEPMTVFKPDKPDGLSVIVGTNVKYGPAVHEGINWPGGAVQVKAHTVKAHTRETKHGTVRVKSHTVRAHTRQVGPIVRAGRKFIETPGRQLMPEAHSIVAQELAGIQ